MVSRRVRRNRTIAVAIAIVLAVLLIVLVVSCSGASSVPVPSRMPVAAPTPPHAENMTSDDVRHMKLAEVADATWVKQTAEATGIPERARMAYAGAAVRMELTEPHCGLTWNTLAGIGWVESHHGELFGARLDENGTMTEPIFGQPLVGEGTMDIPDFDDGNFDGDPDHDRAVGPMQIIPQTWAAWHIDANWDGDENGQNIDDSALAAANYLCYSSETMTTEKGWRQSLWSYNQLDTYANDVQSKANEYAAAIGLR